MAPLQKDLKILYQRSGNRCAFPGCSKVLTYEEHGDGIVTALSEVAHIVAQSEDGPRGTYPLPLVERDKYDNLILLCEEHHHIVDDQWPRYPVEKLRRWKTEHEERILKATGQAVISSTRLQPTTDYTSEAVYSTLLPVVRMPQYIYTAPCKYGESKEAQIKQEIVYPQSDDMVPFIVRQGRLLCFNDLNLRSNPFQKLIDSSKIIRYSSSDFWIDPDRKLWFVQLLNRSLNKLTGRRGLNFDREHDRYYFQPKNAGQKMEISYQPLNQAVGTRRVVWQPLSKLTGTPKNYWFHLAVALHFHHVGSEKWCLSIRPEMHLTHDGLVSYTSEKVGRRITKRASRRYNYDLLGDIQFWRNFLSGGSPRILFPFGRGQYIEVLNLLIEAEIFWPGTPWKHAKPFKNVSQAETLFSLAELDSLHVPADEWELHEDEDEWNEEELAEADEDDLWDN